MGFVEDDEPVEVLPCPFENLIEPGRVASTRTECRISHEEYALAHPDRDTELPLAKRLDVDGKAAERAPVAAGIFEQSFVLGNPDVAPFAPHPPIEDDGSDLPSFPCTSSVTKKVAHAVGVPLGARLQGAALVVGLKPSRQIAGMRACGIDQGLGLRSG